MTLVFKSAVVLALIAIAVSLFSGLAFMLKDQSASHRTVRALTIRIAISVILFLIVLAGMLTGVIVPGRPM
jgi:putative copper export protein